MRLIHGAAALIMASSLAACGSSDKPEAKPTKSVTQTQARYSPCDLLTQPERDKAVGKVADFQGGADFYFPDWVCTYGDAPQQTSTASVSYGAMRATEWAAQLTYIIDTTPAEVDPKAYLARTLKGAGITQEEVTTLDDAGACKLWAAFVRAGDWTIVDDVWTTSDKEDDQRVADASTCVDGVFSNVRVIAADADSSAGRKRAQKALALVQERAIAKLPKS